MDEDYFEDVIYDPFADWEPEMDEWAIVEADYELLPFEERDPSLDFEQVYPESQWPEYAGQREERRRQPGGRERLILDAETAWQQDEDYFSPARHRPPVGQRQPAFDLITVVVALVVILLAGGFLWGGLARPTSTLAEGNGQQFNGAGGSILPTPTAMPASVILPYDEYTLTQGIHGQSYGHLAIDLAAGRGAPIKAPLTGKVTDLFIDHVGNTVLVLENEQYRVTLMHGEYFVRLGAVVQQGEIVGTESNIGYTTDMAGNRCRTTECGHHTHLNLYDKNLGTNINPLAALGLYAP